MDEIITTVQLEILSLFLNNYSNRFHLREIARKINKTHSTVKNHISKLKIIEEEKKENASYYFLKKNHYTPYFLSFGELNKTINSSDLVTLMSKNLTIKNSKILIFGSVAKNKKNPNDIDLLIINGDEEVFKSVKEFEKTIGINIQLINMSNLLFEEKVKSKDILIKEMIKNHIILSGFDYFVREFMEL